MRIRSRPFRALLPSLVILNAVVVTAPTVPVHAVASDQSVAYQVNVAHSGEQADSTLVPPLNEKWRRTFADSVSYPLIVDGRIFVTVANPDSYGTMLFALDAADGRELWSRSISGTYFWSNAAYDGGRVFVVNFDGVLSAFDAVTGALNWQIQLPGQYAFSSPPTADSGVVYVGGAGSGGTVYAVDETNGAVLWTASVANGDNSSPALSADSVYVSYACAQVYSFARATGALNWHHSTDCSGGGGRTPVLSRGRLYVRDFVTNPPGYVFDAGSGNVIRRYSADPAPAFSGRYGFFLDNHRLSGRPASNPRVNWSFTGDGGLSTAPLVANGYVYVGSSSGTLYALSLIGEEVWSTNLGASILGPDEHNVSQPLTGMGAGGGLLVLPADNILVALGQ
ncbi:MAG TPA: PQQ-binding-like beta-propeller repeat protein [Actinomycetota bacterium]|nr:PQQ-binding-like beta-propeller repeat protein [Actinomycetota bacterium]